MNLPDLKAKLEIYNVAAFLHVLREGETNQRDDAYTLINGGTHLLSYTDHPYAGQSAPPGRAAGAYQFIPHTWQALVKQYGFADFSPGNQDLGAVALVAGRKALDDVIAGDLDAAIAKCRQEWTSLPGAAENTRLTLARCKEVFAQYGGTLQETLSAKPVPSAPSSERPPASANVLDQPQQDKPMFPLLAALLPSIVQQIPALIGIFGSGGEISTRNQAVAQAVADTVVKATNAVNLQDAVEKMKTDDVARAAAQAQVLAHPDVAKRLSDLAPVLDKLHGMDKDRWASEQVGKDAAAERSTKDRWDMTKALVVFAGATSSVMVGSLLAAILWQVLHDGKDPSGALLGIAGPLLMASIQCWREIFAYRFDGTHTSTAATVALEQK